MSFEIALSGINAVNSQLNTISNNIANTGTYGFKSSRANFASMYAGTQPTGTEVASLTQSIGTGGSVLTTGRSLDASIQGRGFFVTRDSSGEMLYTRVGIFATDKSGFVVDNFGRKVQGYGAAAAGQALGAMGDLSVPIIVNDNVVAVLDIDSPKHARFTAEVQKEIEAVVDVLATLNW